MPSIAFSAPRDLAAIAGWLTVALPVTLAVGPAVIDIVLVAICLLFIWHCYQERDFGWLKEAPAALLAAVWVFTTIRSAIADPSLKNIGIAASWIRFPLLAAALGTWILQDKLWQQRLLFSAAATCGVLSLDGIFQYVVGKNILGNTMEFGRLTGMLGKPRLGSVIAWMLLPAVFGLVQARATWWAFGLALVSVITIALSGDRMPLLFILAGLSACVVLSPTLRRDAWKALLIAGAILVAVMLARPDVYGRQVVSTVEAVRNVSKTHYGLIWDRALVMARASPLLGVGINRYRATCYDPAYGPVADFRGNGSACADHPHNLYLEWLVEGGLLALAGFVGALLLIGRDLVRAWPVLRTDAVFAALLVTLALRFLPISTATSMMRSWYSMPLWLMVGWAFAMARAVLAERQRPQSA